MNYRLSIATNRVGGRNCYVLEKEGRTINDNISSLQGNNMKQNQLITLIKGMRVARGLVKHKDLLVVEIPNKHLCNWLSGSVEYSDYQDLLEEAFEVLESMDCRYRFIFMNPTYASKYMVGKDISKIPTKSAKDVMMDLL